MRVAWVVGLVVSISSVAVAQEGGAFSPPADAPRMEEAPTTVVRTDVPPVVLTPRMAQLKQELYAARVYRDEHNAGAAITGAILSRLATVALLAVLASTPYNQDSTRNTLAGFALVGEAAHLGFVVLSMVRLAQQGWGNGYVRALEDEAARLGLVLPREF